MNSLRRIMYTTVAQITGKLGTLTADQQSYFQSVVDAGVDEQINALTGTQFGSVAVVDVYVDCNESGSTLVIPTMHDITAVAHVAEDGTETVLTVDSYYTYPRGTGNKYAIKGINDTLDTGTGCAYKITGVLGYKEIPGDIVAAATELAVAGLSANVNNLKSERVGDWSATYSDGSSVSSATLDNLSRYKRLSRSI